MAENPTTPDPLGQRSSVVKPRAEVGKPPSSVIDVIPSARSNDDSPTVISANRPQVTSAEAIAQGLQGKQLGQFELIEPVGTGGMAAVILARDMDLGRNVALKILPPEMAADPENIARFKQEARSAARLDHENIARVYFCGEDQGLHFIAFEFVEGVDLRTLLERDGRLEPRQAVKYMLQVAAGLEHAAERGVTHRDIKPSNILITPEERAKIVDMGLARSADVHGGVTQSGVTLGTFDYISPEQALEPRSADVRSDIYSLGCTFYHLLTGVPPVPDGTAAKKLHHHQNIAPRDPREFNPAIPDELVGVLGKMMAKEPRDRYQRPNDLIQHLMAIAQKMNLLGEAGSHERVLFVDVPLPNPSRLSPVLLAVAAVASVAILAVILGMGGGSGEARSIAIVPAGKSADNGSVPPTGNAGAQPEPSTGVTSEPRQAATIEELAALLEQKADYIILTGEEYDFNELAKDDERAIPALVARRGLKLVGRLGPKGKRPVLRWRVEAPMMANADAPLTLLTLSGAAAGQSELKDLRFEIRASESDSPVFAVAASGLGKLIVSNCEFLHEGKPESPLGGAIRFDGPVTAGGTVELDRCWFERGSKAIDLSNRAMVRARDCAFGPHDVLFLFHERAVPASAAGERSLAELTHCSVLMNSGTIFDAQSNVSGTIRAGNCLFARGSDSGEVLLVRQNDSRQQIVVNGPAGGQRGRNAYYGLVYWAVDSKSIRAFSPDECRQYKLAFQDSDAVDLPRGRSPFQNSQPLQVLENPRFAFALQTARRDLRTIAGNELIGVRSCSFGELYLEPLPIAQDEPAEGTANERIVDASQPTDERQHRYRTLAEAAADSKSGELTILIRSIEPIEIPTPIVLARGNQKLTIRPEGNKRPVLTLAESDLPNPALFTVHSGSLTLKGLHFRLKPAQSSVVNIAGSGQCQFEDCLATLDAVNDSSASLVALTFDPESIKKSPPKIKLVDCFVRGRGNVVSVRGSRPFECEATNTLAALYGSFVAIAGQTKDAPLSPQSLVTCKRVTTYLSEPFLDVRSGDEKKPVGLTPTEVRADGCLFVAAGDRPLVYASGVDRDTLTHTLLKWEASRNLYGNFTRLLDVKANGAMGVMMPTEWTSSKWLEFTHESDNSFGSVKFTGNVSDLTKTIADDFLRAKLSDMKKTDAVATDYGAALNQLPRPDDE